jgi:hypothetical protein
MATVVAALLGVALIILGARLDNLDVDGWDAVSVACGAVIFAWALFVPTNSESFPFRESAATILFRHVRAGLRSCTPHRALFAVGSGFGLMSLQIGLAAGFFGGCCMIAGAIVRGQPQKTDT